MATGFQTNQIQSRQRLMQRLGIEPKNFAKLCRSVGLEDKATYSLQEAEILQQGHQQGHQPPSTNHQQDGTNLINSYQPTHQPGDLVGALVGPGVGQVDRLVDAIARGAEAIEDDAAVAMRSYVDAMPVRALTKAANMGDVNPSQVLVKEVGQLVGGFRAARQNQPSLRPGLVVPALRAAVQVTAESESI